MSAVSTARAQDVFTPDINNAQLDDLVLAIPERRPPPAWYIAISLTSLLAMFGVFCLAYTVYMGIGVWGNNRPVMWAFDIINFVFWIGIGHAGTLISAILFLFRQRWRNAIARFAEAMTIFAVMCAGIFPLMHTGRPWLAAYWLFPYPNTRQLWVNFSSPLLWDVFAVSTYFTVSALFWYVGLIPDLASMRERAVNPIRKFLLTTLSLGWTGSARHWQHYEKAYLILAGLATPLVLSVHSVVSFDFAVSILPGWHSTIFPPFFVAGAVFSGFAMVLLVLLLARSVLRLQSLITMEHLETMNKVILTTSLIMTLAYLSEIFVAWFSKNQHEEFAFLNRAFGPYAWAFWLMMACNVLAPQILWFKSMRRCIPVMAFVALAVILGMWLERFVIIVVSLHRDFMPAAWGMYAPTWVDLGILAGSFGIFFTLVLLFTRVLPLIATSEVKIDLPGSQSHGIEHGGSHV